MSIYKNIKRKVAAITLVALFSVGAVGILSGSTVSAASTHSWTGTACNVDSPGVPDCNWSTISNWDTGTAPTSGDALVFDTSALNNSNVIDGGIPINDIVGLAVSSITFTGSATTLPITINMTQDLTVTSGITNSSSETLFFNGNIVLGGDVTINSNYSVSGAYTYIGSNDLSNTIALNSYKLSFTDSLWVYSSITGDGTVEYNKTAQYFTLLNNNTYSGTTQVLSGWLAGADIDMFGTSSVFVGANGLVDFTYNSNKTIDNEITVEGLANGSDYYVSLGFDGGASVTPVTISVPNIVLNGSTRFSNDTDSSIVDLAGINANGHCVQYMGTNSDTTDGPANGFLNGPAGCTIDIGDDVAAVIGVPNTAIKQFILANPFVIAGLGILTIGMIIFTARRFYSKR